MKRSVMIAVGCTAFWLAVVAPASAQVRAWLDRNQVSMGESVTLTIESDQLSTKPDLAPLMADFVLEGQSQARSLEWINGRQQSKTTFAISLAPKRPGTLTVPAVVIGAARTAPITLLVSGADPSAATVAAQGATLEIEIDDPSPYVQQSVGVTLRLLYAVPLVSGQLDLDPPQGASLQRIGDDVQSVREVDGRRYNVVERKFLLVPERSGELTIPAPRFAGRGAGGWMDDLLGGNSRELSATGQPKTLAVRAQPDNAPQPWLPVRDLRLRYVAVPQAARAGEAATLVVEAIAQGATQAQMPELAAPSIPGAQVFAEPAEYDETFVGGTPQVKMTRRYSIVPNAAGPLRVPGPRQAWWDVRAGAAQLASLPDLTLDVSAGSGSFAAPSGSDIAAAADPGLPMGAASPPRWLPGVSWAWLAVAFAGLWLLTLVWAVWRKRAAPPRLPAAASRTHAAAAVASHSQADLKRALETGSLDEVGDVLRGMHAPALADLDALLLQLDSAAQRQAVELLRRARWADGDGSAARRALHEAFGNGPLWRAAGPAPKSLLPPLYPER